MSDLVFQCRTSSNNINDKNKKTKKTPSQISSSKCQLDDNYNKKRLEKISMNEISIMNISIFIIEMK